MAALRLMRLSFGQTAFKRKLHQSNARKDSQSDNLDLVEVERIGKVMTIGINRPEQQNFICPATEVQLNRAFNQFEQTNVAFAAVLFGKGGNFCAGWDTVSSSSHEIREHRDNDGTILSRRVFRKPVIAAVDGCALAGGLELALLCDLRVLEISAVVGVISQGRDAPLLNGGTVRLPALIGLSRALDLVLTGRTVSGKEALEMGLANRLVAHGTALGQAIQLANSISRFPQACMLADRASCYFSLGHSVQNRSHPAGMDRGDESVST